MNIVNISDTLFLARGGERDIYMHPNDNSKIIKIIFRDKKHNNQNELDFQYMNYLEKNNIPLLHIPKCFGWVNTNKGLGLVFERVENYDKSQIFTLSHYTKYNIIKDDVVKLLIDELKEYLFSNDILFVDASLSNVFCQKVSSSKYKLIIFDGLGGRRPGIKFSLYLYSKLFTRYKIKKQWQIFLSNYKYERSLKLKLL